MRSTLPSPAWLVTLVLLSCQAPNALRNDVAPDGEPVRIETAEETADAVGDTEVAQCMVAYRAQSEAGSVAHTDSGNPPTAVAEDQPDQAEQEDEGEVPVSVTVAADRLLAHLAHPTSTRIVSAEDLGITDTTVAAFDPFEERGCPPEGTAKSSSAQKLNRLKNRISKPHASDVDGEVTLDALRAPTQDDRGRWSTGTAATIEGYCRLAKAAGGETCNCGKTKTTLTDTHFEIVSGPNDNGQPVIAEVTQVWRLIHKHFNQEDWSSSALHSKYQGHKVGSPVGSSSTRCTSSRRTTPTRATRRGRRTGEPPVERFIRSRRSRSCSDPMSAPSPC